MVKRAVLAAALAAALAGGCRDEEEGAAGLPGEPEGEVVAIVRRLPPSTSGGIREPARDLIWDASVWEKVWARANANQAPVPKAPAVDFSKEMVALAALGEKRTSGHSVEIVAVRVSGGRLRIHFAERAPGPKEVAAQVLTCPWHAVVIPRSDLEVEWVRYEPPGRR